MHNYNDDEVEKSEFSENSDSDSEKTVKKEKQNNSGSIPTLFALFCNFNLQPVFPTLFILLKIALTLPATSATTERFFSKLSLIENHLRTTMSEDRLENLMVIAIENYIEIDYEEVINTFANSSDNLRKNLII